MIDYDMDVDTNNDAATDMVLTMTDMDGNSAYMAHLLMDTI